MSWNQGTLVCVAGMLVFNAILFLVIRRQRKAEELLKQLHSEMEATKQAIADGDLVSARAHDAKFWEIDAQLTKLLWK